MLAPLGPGVLFFWFGVTVARLKKKKKKKKKIKRVIFLMVHGRAVCVCGGFGGWPIRAAFHSPSRRAPRLGPVQRRRAERQHAAHTDAEAKGCLARARSERRAASHRLRGGAAVWTIMQGCLEEDFAALRKLRDESECDELKQAWSANDPREWKCSWRRTAAM